MFNEEFVKVVERFNAAHSPDVEVAIAEKIENDVHLYFVRFDGNEAPFVASPKSSKETFERRLEGHYETIQKIREARSNV